MNNTIKESSYYIGYIMQNVVMGMNSFSGLLERMMEKEENFSIDLLIDNNKVKIDFIGAERNHIAEIYMKTGEIYISCYINRFMDFKFEILPILEKDLMEIYKSNLSSFISTNSKVTFH